MPAASHCPRGRAGDPGAGVFALRAPVLLLVATAVGGCSDQSMTRQPHYGPNSPASIFASGSSAQTPPEGAVSQESLAYMKAAADPPPVDMALLRRGKERFEIFCAPCHGFEGDGDGADRKARVPAPALLLRTGADGRARQTSL